MVSSDRGHAVSCSTQDYDFFYAGLERGQLMIQQCDSCRQLRNPPTPMCARCGSLDWSAAAMSGDGILYSYTIHRHPPLPGFPLPHAVGLVELDEGIRVVAGLDPIALPEIAIGRNVTARFKRRGTIATLCFGLRDIS